jgi:DNA-binding NarL/FixJ family response regulator
VVAGDMDARFVLRSLLQLHRLQVVGEAEGATQALELLRDHRPRLMVADVDLAEGRAPALIADARAILPELRVILISPAARNQAATPDAAARPDVELTRPFPLRQFGEAVLSGELDPRAHRDGMTAAGSASTSRES